MNRCALESTGANWEMSEAKVLIHFYREPTCSVVRARFLERFFRRFMALDEWMLSVAPASRL